MYAQLRAELMNATVSASGARFDRQSNTLAKLLQRWLELLECEYFGHFGRYPWAHEVEWVVIAWYVEKAGGSLAMLPLDRIPKARPGHTREFAQEDCRWVMDDWVRGCETIWRGPIVPHMLWRYIVSLWLMKELQQGVCHSQ